MLLPSIDALETNLRHCLLLKADDLYFTLAEPYGAAVRNEFLGIPVDGLADENLSDDQIGTIGLERFDVARRLRELYAMLELRGLSLHREHHPDSEDGRNDGIQFLEHFLSTLPRVALGGVDITGVRHGEVNEVYQSAYAWLNLIDTIADAFDDKDSSALTVSDLALLSGLDVRTLRNRCGPDKLLRTTAARSSLPRGSAAAAFVSINGLDALDWLRARKDFKISMIDPAWLRSRVAGIRDSTPHKSRGLIIAGVVNRGPLSSLAPEIGAAVEDTRHWFDQGSELPPQVSAKLCKLLGLNS